MGQQQKRMTIDGHVHLRVLDGIPVLTEIAAAVGLDRVNLACSPQPTGVNKNPGGLLAKAEHPDLFYLFLGLDHSTYLSEGRIEAPPLAEQVDRLMELGADGIKMLESKPTLRKTFDKPLDSEYYDAFFSRLEETGFPLLWHVNDPKEFWDPERVPEWAKKLGWLYDDSYVGHEELYAEVERVLDRHPGTRAIFPHLYFLDRALPRAAQFLERHPNASLDFAPGYIPRASDEARDFFMKYADRVLFGTDISNDDSVELARRKAKSVRRFLESSEAREDGSPRGISLPAGALEKIYRLNFERLAGPVPKPLRREFARAECGRIAEEIDRFAGGSAGDNHARLALSRLSEHPA